MIIKISIKKSFSKPSILTIIRSDDSSTWSKLRIGMETHDLAHYAVEKVLNFTSAFYGIINKGFNISDFELPKEQRPNLITPESLVTEHIVNLLEVEFLNSGNNHNFIEDLKQILSDNNLPFPNNLNSETLINIRDVYQKLVLKWKALKDDEILNLELSF